MTKNYGKYARTVSTSPGPPVRKRSRFFYWFMNAIPFWLWRRMPIEWRVSHFFEDVL